MSIDLDSSVELRCGRAPEGNSTKLRIPQIEFEALRTLNHKGVEYLLIGGFAMRFYGKRRSARDVDLLVGNSVENAGKLFEAVRILLGYTPTFTQRELSEPCKKLPLGNYGPDLDILTSVIGLDFDSAYQRREQATENGLVIPVASKNDLVFIKRAARDRDKRRRRKEQRDIEFLQSI